MRVLTLLTALCLLAATPSGRLWAQAPVPPSPDNGAPDIGILRAGASKAADTNRTVALKFNAAPLDQVLQFYSDLTSRTLLSAPSLTAVITLRSQTDLTIPEAIQAVKTVLAMNNVGLVEVGTKFVKVVPIATAQQEGLAIQSNMWQQVVHEENDELMSEIIPLKFIEPAEVQKAITGLIHTYGKIMLLERINSILVADTSININRIKSVITQIDQPIEAKEKLNIISIHHAKASDIKARLEEILADQKDKDKQPTIRRLRETGAPGVETIAPTIPGIIRARPTTPSAAGTPATDAEAEEGKMIRGSVKIIADDRTGILLIITHPDNMEFFEQVVTALDVATSPDVTIKVLRLEYANSEDVASMLNALIGAASAPHQDAAAKKTGSTSSTSSSSASSGKTGETSTEPARSSQLQEFVEQQRQAAASRGPEAKTKIGQLSAENIKILSDKRSNALIIMASVGDTASILEIVKGMDIMLSQVLIEAVILQVKLGNNIQSGVNWVQRQMIDYETKNGVRTPSFAFSGGGGGAGTAVPTDQTLPLTSSSLTSSGGVISAVSGLTYYFTHTGLNLDAVISWSATSSRTKILSSPVILTTDNKEAKIDVSDEIYVLKGLNPNNLGNGVVNNTPNIESRKVGLNLVVTPRINQKKFVVMDIVQKLDSHTSDQPIQGQGSWPIISSRELSASVAVRSGETIILGGLVENSDTVTETKVPILGDIPILGYLFKSKSSDKPRTEIIVFLTPHVLDTPEEIAAESERRKQASNAKDMWERGGWSESKLAEPKQSGFRQWWRNLLK